MNTTLTEKWWEIAKPFSEETPYFNAYDTTAWNDPDTDGDGKIDGSDDQDFDGWSNVSEISRHYTGWFVHPFNPCLPDPRSARCSEYIPATMEKAYPPFNGELDWDHDDDASPTSPRSARPAAAVAAAERQARLPRRPRRRPRPRCCVGRRRRGRRGQVAPHRGP
jgi:hypothetical protein